MKTSCPRCNSKQKFIPHQRKVRDNYYDLFIKCNLCRWEKVVFSGESSKIEQYKQISKLQVKYKNDPQLKKTLAIKLKKLNAKTDT
jgi:ribosomal protein S27E